YNCSGGPQQVERGRHLSRQQQQQQQHFQGISQSVCTSAGERRVQQPGADARSSLPEISAQRITNLHRHLTALVTNIQTAADARESMRRKDLEEAREMRSLLENDMKSSQEKFAEITKGWSLAKDYVHAEELQIALDDQQRLLTILLQEKKSLINHLQEELKVGDDRFVKDLRKQTEERDLMLERMEDQIRTLTLAYREELLQTQVDLDRLTERRKTVAEHEAKIHSLIFHTLDKQTAAKIEQNTKLQVKSQPPFYTDILINETNVQITHLKASICPKSTSKVFSTMNASRRQSSESHTAVLTMFGFFYLAFSNSSTLCFAPVLIDTRQITLADTRTFEDMWLTVDAEVKQLVEKALDIDSLICKQHYGIAWQRPQLPVRGVHSDKHFHRSGHLQFSGLSQTNPASHRSRGMKTETDTESTDVEVCKDRSDAQTAMKLGSLLSVSKCTFLSPFQTYQLLLHLNDLSHYRIKIEQIDITEVRSNRASSVDLFSTSSARHTEAWSSSEDKAYWESLGNIISEDKVKLWEETEKRLKQYNSVLTEISELITETDSLKQQNAELRMLLQQSLNPQVRMCQCQYPYLASRVNYKHTLENLLHFIK
uniref:Dynein regulatory complex protein 1 n=1 Tax=Cynoglossus semilaevis TaxID=244447 RepID=A0A3P8UE18_CYNSE